MALAGVASEIAGRPAAYLKGMLIFVVTGMAVVLGFRVSILDSGGRGAVYFFMWASRR